MLAATYKIDIIYDPQPRMQWYMHIHSYNRTMYIVYILLLVCQKSVYNFWEMWSAVVWDIV